MVIYGREVAMATAIRPTVKGSSPRDDFSVTPRDWLPRECDFKLAEEQLQEGYDEVEFLGRWVDRIVDAWHELRRQRGEEAVMPVEPTLSDIGALWSFLDAL